MVASAPGRITPHRAPPPYEELDLRHEFERLFSGKSTKNCCHQSCTLGLTPVCTKSFVGWRSPQTPLGELTALPQTP